MRLTFLLALAAATAAIAPASAQSTPRARVYTFEGGGHEEHRAALGLTTGATGSLRDTLGLMITSITRGSPAERAGLEEGNRLAAINGVSLRANAVDVEDAEYSGTLSRRLVRELGKSKAGDEVELRVYREGRTATLKVKTADADTLFRLRNEIRVTAAAREDRPALGFGLGSSGSRRDTLGVLVMSVADSTPAARAGLEEGNRIAAINGLNLRVAADDAGDRYLGGARAQRLQREIAALKPGSDVTLRVYSNGQFRDVRMKVAREGDLPRDGSRFLFLGGERGMMAPMGSMRPMSPMVPGMAMPPVAPVPPTTSRDEFHFELGPEFRRQIEEMQTELRMLGPELESIGPILERLRPELERVRVEIPKAVRRAREATMAQRTSV